MLFQGSNRDDQETKQIIGIVIRFLKEHKALIYGGLLFLSLIPLLLKLGKKEQPVKSKSERYISSLNTVNSLEKAETYVDEQYALEGLKEFDTAVYVKTATRFTKDRFFHGLARYDFADNWICYLSSKIAWDHFSAIVDPDDILDHAEGLCSQQSIVYMELLKKKGIKTRSVGLGYKEGPGHFLTEVFYKGSWHLHDVTMEPQWERVKPDHGSMAYYQQHKGSLFPAYEKRLSKSTFNKIMERVEYGIVDTFPARKMLWFHRITNVITYVIPLYCLFAILVVILKERPEEKRKPETTLKHVIPVVEEWEKFNRS
ncbi:MAG: hypothetical protein K0S33_2210 [Bacteroidetes bacterium]|jgi:hypothetical protein|nr:hypothetical protein [Bacteroidota bacterium]